MNSRWWLVLERAQATLPVLAAGALAGFTWWLVQSSGGTGSSPRQELSASTPDYQLEQVRVARFDADGRLDAVLEGAVMRHFKQSDLVLIDQVVFMGRDPKGQSVRATALQGQADQVAEVVTLSGGAVVRSTPAVGTGGAPAEFRGETLTLKVREDLVTSSKPVLFTQAGNVLRAQSLRHDEKSGVTQLGGRVTGQYRAVAR